MPRFASISSPRSRRFTDSKQAAKRHDVPELEGDPFLGAQDWEIGSVEIAVTDTAPDHATATAKFMNFKDPQTVTTTSSSSSKAGVSRTSPGPRATAPRQRCAGFM
jgi:hypothetical protein